MFSVGLLLLLLLCFDFFKGIFLRSPAFSLCLRPMYDFYFGLVCLAVLIGAGLVLSFVRSYGFLSVGFSSVFLVGFVLYLWDGLNWLMLYGGIWGLTNCLYLLFQSIF